MKNRYLAGLAIGILMFGVCGVAEATLTVIPMEQNNWNLVEWGNQGNTPTWEQNSEGIKFYGAGYRDASSIISKQSDDFSDSVVYFKWMAHAGDNQIYFAPVPLVSGAPQNGIGPNYTTGWSWNGSSVLPTDTWLYTRMDINPDRTWNIITATGNYDNMLGGLSVSSQYENLQSNPNYWDFNVKNGHLAIVVGDNYGGTSSWVLLGEAKYETSAAPVPEPATMLLMGTGLAGFIGVRRKKKNS
jgi:hypothetical protein